ncbi:MAG: NAD(P)H-dependent oxidoreductase [Ginsengibacter sp.]
MYTIISGTNRIGSHTERVAKEYQRILKNKNIDAKIFSLKNLDVLHRSEEIAKLEIEILIPTKKFIFIVPEYNGSYPGVLKALIDNSDIRKVWNFKKALLTGVATGRAGNLRGMDHLSDTLHYLKMTVFYNKLPISVIDKIMNEEGHLNEETLKVVNKQIDEFLIF